MKSASTNTLIILSGGAPILADLYSFTLATGQTYYFTSFDTSLSAAIYPSSTKHTYQTGWMIKRGSTTQATGVDAQELALTIAPQLDAPGGPPTIAGYSLQQAIRLGLLDNASMTYSRLYMSQTSVTNPALGTYTPPYFAPYLDTSPGAVGFFTGVVSDCDPVERFSVEMKISSNLLVLNQVQMPRNLFQAPCVHTVYDNGCALLEAAFTVSGKVGSTITNGALFYTTPSGGGSWNSSTYPDTYFNLGVITFTSGANNGFSATIKQFTNTNGVLSLMLPMPANLATGDTFTMYPGCDHTLATCIAKFNNKKHFKGTPFVPVSETLYDGGTSNPPSSAPPMTQAGNIIGSTVGGQLIQVTG